MRAAPIHETSPKIVLNLLLVGPLDHGGNLDAAFGLLGLRWEDCVRVDPRYFRPTEAAAGRDNDA